MKEIEVKVLEINKEKIAQRLEELGAKKVFDDVVVSSYFDFENNRLKNNNQTLRLRQKGTIGELTFKQLISKDKAKIMNELEVKVDKIEIMKNILNELGLKEFKQDKKHRTSYVLDDIHFELDTYPGIPTFLEIEAPSLNKIRESVEKLGLSMSSTKPWSGKDVLKHYGKLD